MVRCGSSPRVRGTGQPCNIPFTALRLIPAGAGNRDGRALTLNPAPAHPRGCGEQRLPKSRQRGFSGSSPPVRGTGMRPPHIEGCQRLIPAGAGNRTDVDPRRCKAAAHPRGCGEQSAAAFACSRSSGSSPRVRGTVAPVLDDRAGGRLIPAGAGNSIVRRQTERSRTAHPRGCGEQGSRSITPGIVDGSSPRVRGTGCAGPCRDGSGRLIPAGAGNRHVHLCGCEQRPAHPRGCGEQFRTSPSAASKPGSSPRVRGTGAVMADGQLTPRLIPAGAGNRT